MSDSDGFDLGAAISEGAEAATQYAKTIFGTRKEVFTCPDCNAACEESHTHNAQTAAFDGGACPSWECPECGRNFTREAAEETYALDLYDRG